MYPYREWWHAGLDTKAIYNMIWKKIANAIR